MIKTNLEIASRLINLNTHIKTTIQLTYEDYGANLMFKNVISISPEEYQVLDPRQVHLAEKGELPLEEVIEVINKINKRGW